MPRRKQVSQDLLSRMQKPRKARTINNRELKINSDWKLIVNADRYRLIIEAFKNNESQGEHVWGLAKEPTQEEEEENGPSRVVLFHSFTAKNGYQTHQTLKRFRSKTEAEIWLQSYIERLEVVLENDERVTG